MMIDILQSSQDRTFSYRDLQNDNGVDYDHKNNTVSIKQPFIRSDNIQILSI
ncbi:MAG: hypothetical protein LBU27_01425 [Candidatus Peribacteria bacterium]|nr:hypothetical protein [Candidatus Peribacteria bacterium]